MPKRRRMRIFIGAAAALLVGVGVIARAYQRADVVVTPVVRGRVIDAVYATGTVEAQPRVTVKARVAGPLVDVAVAEGSRVSAGERLARIDNPAAAYELERSRVEASQASAQSGSDAPQLAALRAQVAELSSSLAAARREAERAGQLWSKGAGGKADWERARDQVSELEARLAAKQAQERAQRIDLDANRGRTQAVVRSLATRVADADVRAPLDGVVLARYVEPGEVVAVNQPIYKIGDIRSLLLEVTIDESDVARVHDGATPSKVAATLNAFPGRVFAGHVTQLMPDADREKKTYLAKVALDEPVAGLRSGMTVEVNIIVEEHTGVLLAPADAIVDNEAWVVRDGRVERRRVELGIHDLVRAEVKSGLAEGDQLVIGGGERLSRGKRVRTSERAPDPLAAPGAQGGTARSAG